MKEKGKAKLEEFFSTRPVFTLDEFARFYGKRVLSDASNTLKYHQRNGRIINIARKIYATVPYGSEPDRFQPDRYLVAKAAREDAVFCYHSALELLGAGHSVWNICTVFSNRKRNSIDLGHVKIKFLNTPESLNDDPYLGTVNVYRMNIALRVTGRERTLVEGFRKPVHSGGLEEHIESISGFGVLDLDQLKLILKVYNQKKLWASVGWFLSRNTERFGVSEDYIGEFESHRPSSPQYLSSQQRTGQLHNRWNLIIPESLNERFEGDAT